jgi:glycosyltransferase involved in cell wall biosynthesis
MDVLFFVKGVPHSFYKEQFSFSPKGVTYVPSTKLLNVEERTAIEFSKNYLEPFKSIARNGLKAIGVPSIAKVDTECELIHSCETLLISNKPWVVDFEDASSLCWFDPRMLKGRTKRIIETLIKSEKCRKLLPWTNAAKQSIEQHLDVTGIKNKIEVVYPAVTPKILKKVKKRKRGIDFLFVGKYFYSKGGMETILGFEELSKRYDANLHMVTQAPKEIVEKYSKNKQIHFYNRIKEMELERLYKDCDVFVLPFHLDSLGYVILEAMSWGLPCIIPDNYSGSELVKDGKNGLLVKDRIENYRFNEKFMTVVPPINKDEDTLFLDRLKHPSREYLQQIYKSMEKFVSDGRFKNNAGKESYYEVERGKFSGDKRRKILKRIYEESLGR